MVLMIAGASLNQHKPVSSSEDFAITMLDMNENKRYKLCGSILNHLDNGVHWGSKKFRALYFVYQVKTIWGHLYFLQTCTPNEEIQSLVLMVYAHVPEHHSLLPALSPWWSWAVTPNQLSWLGKSRSINFHQHNTSGGGDHFRIEGVVCRLLEIDELTLWKVINPIHALILPTRWGSASPLRVLFMFSQINVPNSYC